MRRPRPFRCLMMSLSASFTYLACHHKAEPNPNSKPLHHAKVCSSAPLPPAPAWTAMNQLRPPV